MVTEPDVLAQVSSSFAPSPQRYSFLHGVA
jgi:hypothetical protein